MILPVPSRRAATSVADLTLFLIAALYGKTKNYGNLPVEPFIDKDITQVVDTMPEEYWRLIGKSKKWGKLNDRQKVEIAKRWKQDIFDEIEKKGYMDALTNVLTGRTIGLLGFGPIAQEVARKLAQIKTITGVKFTVIAHSRSLKADDPIARELGVTPVSRADLFSRSNIVSIHIPGIKELALTTEEIMKINIAAIINTSRPQLDGDGVMDFINHGGVYMGDMDLTDNLGNRNLYFANKAAVFPHIGASTADAAAGVEKRTIESLIAMADLILGNEQDTEVPEIDIVNDTTPKVIADLTLEELDQLSIERIWDTVKLLHKSQMEIFVPQSFKLTEETLATIKEMNTRLGKDIIKLIEFTSEDHLRDLLKREKAPNTKRMLIAADPFSESFIKLNIELFRDLRMISIKIQDNYDTQKNKTKTLIQLEYIMISALARLLDGDKTSMAEMVLKSLLQARYFKSETDLNSFLWMLKEDNNSDTIYEIYERVKFFLARPVSLIEDLVKTYMLSRYFWVSA